MEGTEQRARKMEKIQKKPDHRHSNPTSIDEYLSNQSSDHLVVACSHSMAAKTVVNSFLEAKIHPCSDGACGCVFAKHFHFHFIWHILPSSMDPISYVCINIEENI
jgi:hypothetical protein